MILRRPFMEPLRQTSGYLRDLHTMLDMLLFLFLVKSNTSVKCIIILYWIELVILIMSPTYIKKARDAQSRMPLVALF